HASVSSTIDALEEEGFQVTRILPDENGVFHAEDFIRAVAEDTCLVSMMLAENETGRILPVQDVFRRIKKKHPHVILHCDAVPESWPPPMSICP
ncbi:MAG: aminotransferase class V-fold PLP-dependent enzyme, partial [Bacteroidales bacterium]|nr:aminotransferase class V-fold PLP-dependent enzyme [Bacteroidales bacterium]